ncbi:MAG: hypothetical protein JXQ87_16635 [Bacteroidia bacterium]
MSRVRAKDDAKGLDKLLKLSVLGTALIIVVYSIYYYSNSYKYSRTNLYNADVESDLVVLQSIGFDGLSSSKSNILGTNNHIKALQNGLGGWGYEGNADGLYINERTTAAFSGAIQEGFGEAFDNELKKRFHNAPPVLIEPVEGIAVRSIQFEHFAFPYHAMVNWRKEGLFKTFSFYADSIDGELKVGSNGFRWQSPFQEAYIKVVQQSLNSDIETLNFDTDEPTDLIEMPVVDFDVLYSNANDLGKQFLNSGTKMTVTESKGELKLLVGPSLKQNNAYAFDLEDKNQLIIKPPFTIEIGKSENEKPYFSALIVNEKLLLK